MLGPDVRPARRPRRGTRTPGPHARRRIRSYGIRQAVGNTTTPPPTSSIGDAHTGQLYRIPGGRTAYLDWQTACLAPWAHDVAYFLRIGTRHRRPSHDALLTTTVTLWRPRQPHLTDDVVWEEYRRHSLHGFFWMCVPTVMQPSEVVRAMTHRYGAQIEDLDPFELLGMSH